MIKHQHNLSKMVRVSFATIVSALFAAAVAQETKIRYMPFGDSITEIVCWRGLLWKQLQDAGYKNVDFVGSGTGGNSAGAGCKVAGYDKNNEGHSGFLAIDIASKKQLVDWLKKNPADIISMHLGTNDISRGHKTDEIIASFTTLVQQMRDANPKMKIIVCILLPFASDNLNPLTLSPQVAQIIPLSTGNAATTALNAAIPAWATSKNTTESPIWVVDQYTGYTGTDNRDGVHPGDTGDVKMAAKWYPALVNAIKTLGGTPSTTREVAFVA